MNKQTHKKSFSLKESKQENNRNNDTFRTLPMDTKNYWAKPGEEQGHTWT
jgi:hypothetical protein